MDHSFDNEFKQKRSVCRVLYPQMLGIMLLFVVAWVLGHIPKIGKLLHLIVVIATIVFWIISIISAIQGNKKTVPIVGEMFQDWFKGFG